MNRFCTACGTTNEVDARFCDHCGAALRPRGTTATPPPEAPSSSAPGPTRSGVAVPRRPLVWIGAGVAALVAVGAIGWALMGGGLPSSSEQDRIAQAWLARNQEGLLRDACLTNFPYQRNPVGVNPFDTQTQSWLDALVAAGVYERRDSQGGSLMYAHGPQAAKLIRNGRLCLAEGVEVRELKLEEVAGGDGKAARLNFQVVWTGQPDFATRPPVSERLGARVAPRTESLLLVRRDSGWSEASLTDMAALAGGAAAAGAPAARGGSGPGFGAWLSNLFSFGSGPTSVAEDFSLAVTQGRAADALALIHPAERNPTVDAKVGLLIETQRGQRANAQKFEAEVIQQSDTDALVRLKAGGSGQAPVNDTMRLRKHEGRWYVSMGM